MCHLPIARDTATTYNHYMIKIVYHVNTEAKQEELEWLRDQKIFPACEDAYDWKNNKPYVKIGVIVGSEAALSIKLRHKLDLQTEWRQR